MRRNDPDDPLTQVNVRLPQSLRDRVDARRATLDLSRDVWIERAIRFALDHPPGSPLQTRAGRSLRRIR